MGTLVAELLELIERTITGINVPAELVAREEFPENLEFLNSNYQEMKSGIQENIEFIDAGIFIFERFPS